MQKTAMFTWKNGAMSIGTIEVSPEVTKIELLEEPIKELSNKEKVEELLHKCLDPYIPPVIKDTNQSFHLIAEAIDIFYQRNK